jgi:hypothetical protein
MLTLKAVTSTSRAGPLKARGVGEEEGDVGEVFYHLPSGEIGLHGL